MENNSNYSTEQHSASQTETETLNYDNFHGEYKFFIRQYILPILGIPSSSKIEDYPFKTNAGHNWKMASFDRESGILSFNAGGIKYFYIKPPIGLNDDSENLAINLAQAFTKMSEYSYRITKDGSLPSKKSHSSLFSSPITRDAIYQMAIQKGICSWVIGGKNDSVEELISALERWSVQTYEGKRVTFGFVINPEATANEKLPRDAWISFMKNDYAAVFTDSIHSLIELDADCQFASFLSLTKGGTVDSYDLTPRLPIRFAHSIRQYVNTNNAVGLFLLNNGDIIISKKAQIRFIKRNLRWLNFSFDAFYNAAKSFSDSTNGIDTLLEEVYATVLDVSLAHTGGIIAIVQDINELCATNGQESDLNPYDNLLCEDIIDNTGQDKDSGQGKNKERVEMLKLKRSIVKALINEKTFVNTDRKLRCELAAMDGACILTTDGRFIAAGAIIRNQAGSSGGGRSAASEKLSKYGMAVKISTDGYVELYIKEKLTYIIR